MQLRQLFSSLCACPVVRQTSLRSAPSARPARPHLEALERRDVPTAFTNQVFVSSLYQGLLGRNPSAGELGVGSAALAAGSTPGQVAFGLLGSTEYRAREVSALYPTLLGRSADLAGLNLWVGSLEGGATLDQIKADLLASDEFFARSGNTPQGFLSALYGDVLGRAVDPQGQAIFGPGAAGGGQARRQVALQILGSAEAEQVKLSHDYPEVLGRPLDAGGLSYWGASLAAGSRDEDVLAGLLGSNELFARFASATSSAPAGSDPVMTSFGFLVGHGLDRVASPAGSAAAVAAVDVVQSPAFGVLPFPAGFDPTHPPPVQSASLGAASPATTPLDLSQPTPLELALSFAPLANTAYSSFYPVY